MPEMPSPSNMAVIVMVPFATAVADPLEAGALLTVATLGLLAQGIPPPTFAGKRSNSMLGCRWA